MEFYRDFQNFECEANFYPNCKEKGIIKLKGQVLLPQEEITSEYSTLFLFHGAGGDSHEWTDYRNVDVRGKMNLWAQQEGFKPMILVLPNIVDYGVCKATSDRYYAFHYSTLVDYVNREFYNNISHKPDSIAGLSMGGAAALLYAIKECKKESAEKREFQYIGGFSVGTSIYNDTDSKWISSLDGFKVDTGKVMIGYGQKEVHCFQNTALQCVKGFMKNGVEVYENRAIVVEGAGHGVPAAKSLFNTFIEHICFDNKPWNTEGI